MLWIWIIAVVMLIVLIVMMSRRAEEPQTRHAAPGQGKPPELKEREEHSRRIEEHRTEVYEEPGE